MPSGFSIFYTEKSDTTKLSLPSGNMNVYLMIQNFRAVIDHVLALKVDLQYTSRAGVTTYLITDTYTYV
jgi:hypothetical protein